MSNKEIITNIKKILKNYGLSKEEQLRVLEKIKWLKERESKEFSKKKEISP